MDARCFGDTDHEEMSLRRGPDRCMDAAAPSPSREEDISRSATPSQRRDGSRYASFPWTRMSPTSSCPSLPRSRRRVCRPSSPGDCGCQSLHRRLVKTSIRMTGTAAAAGSNFPPLCPDRLSLSMVLICSLLLRKYCPHKRAHRRCSQLQTMSRLNVFLLSSGPLPATSLYRLSRDVIVIGTGK